MADKVGGQSDRSCSAGAGRRARWQCTNSAADDARNGGRPHRSSYSVAPNEYRSLRRSTGRLTRPVCSGDRYGMLPANRRGCWTERVCRARTDDRLKSISFARPVSGCTTTFEGLTSRWMIPAACTAASPSARSSAIEKTRSSGTGSSGVANPARQTPPKSSRSRARRCPSGRSPSGFTTASESMERSSSCSRRAAASRRGDGCSSRVIFTITGTPSGCVARKTRECAPSWIRCGSRTYSSKAPPVLGHHTSVVTSSISRR